MKVRGNEELRERCYDFFLESSRLDDGTIS